MVGTVQLEFRAAGNGTELADYQPLVVDRIMVKHIVPLEKQRVGHEIIVDGIVAHFDRWVFHNCVQVHGLRVACTWIYLFHHNIRILNATSPAAQGGMTHHIIMNLE